MLNLNKNDINIEASKDKIIKLLLYNQEKLGLINNKVQYNIQYKKYKEILDAKHLTALKQQNGKTNSEIFNNNLQNIFLNLLMVFEQMNNTCNVTDEHKKLNTSIINNLKTKVAKMEDKITVLENTIENSSTEINYVENFHNIDSFETNRIFYNNEDKNKLNMYDGFLVDYDKYNECIKLPKMVSLNKLLSPNGQKTGNIIINKQLGGGFYNIKNPNNNLDKAMDTDMESYWEEVIMADSPIKVEMDKDKYYGVKYGAVCELEIIFNNISKINEISLLSFGEFPIELLAIRYYNTDQPDLEEQRELTKNKSLKNLEILSPNQSELKNCFIQDSKSIQFPSVTAKRLRIIFNQIHYIKNNFIYNKEEMEKNKIWANKNNVSFDAECRYKGIYKDKFNNPTLAIMVKSLENKKINIDNIKEILFPKNNEIVPVMKYEYNYGLYNIGINENIYKPLGIYVSKCIKLKSNIDTLNVLTEEITPENTGINYYIAFKENPDMDEWHSINSNQTYVIKDILQDEYKSIKEKEKFFGTRNKYIELKNTPFIRDNKINIELFITDNNGSSVKCENVTNCDIPSKSYKNFDKDSDKIQYFINENKIFFNKSLDKSYIIIAEYEHLINAVRLKAILYNNNKNGDLTPILNKYKFIFTKI